MTPELKTACEVVFQEHKISNQIKWNRDAFRGQISLGLSELAKETLVRKNIILLPNKTRKAITLLNPAVAGAGSFEEAEEIIITRRQTPVVANLQHSEPVYIAKHVFEIDIPATSGTKQPAKQSLPVTQSPVVIAGTKWYMQPFFCYVIWPLCAAVAGALLTFLISTAYAEIFWR